VSVVVAVIPAEAGIHADKDWMPGQARHDVIGSTIY
jgi:hypothetical protein